ncbi:MAG: hypothetical protein IT245_01260, partial [Bacteroidia bacterium]|nr:hypothetical protein [Bacteroidia bacterium]
TPWIGFLEDEFKWKRKKAAWSFGLVVLLLGLPTVLFFHQGVFDEYDYWAGTVSLVIFAFIEIILFSWVFGIDKGWKEIITSADIKVPIFYKFVIKYVTPLILGLVFFGSIPEIVNTINHVNTRNDIAAMDNPEILLDQINSEKKSLSSNINDSMIFNSNIMQNDNISKDEKNDIINIRRLDSKYKNYSSVEFSSNKKEKIAELENTIFYKNLSRPFLLLIFALIALMVYTANKRRKKQTNPSL